MIRAASNGAGGGERALVLGIYDRGRERAWRADRSRFGAWYATRPS